MKLNKPTALLLSLALCSGIFAFSSCEAEKKSNASSKENVQNMQAIANPDDFFDYYLLDDGTYGVKAGRTAYLTEVVVPATYNGIAVTQIMDDFWGYNVQPKTKKLTISEGIQKINASAFQGSITEHTMKGKNLSLTTVKLPSTVTEIPDYAFANCASLTTVDFSEGLLSIGEYAFVNCSTLTTITFPDSLTELGEYSFYGCAKLNEISFGASLNKIQKGAFYQLENIKKVHVKQDTTWGRENNSIFDQKFYDNTPAENAKKLLSFDIYSWIIK